MSVVTQRTHYQPGDKHRGYPLGGGYKHPAADKHSRILAARRGRRLHKALGATGRWAEYHALRAEQARARDAMRAEVEKMRISKNKYAVDRRVWREYDAARDAMDALYVALGVWP